jgi:hypothetical protein
MKIYLLILSVLFGILSNTSAQSYDINKDVVRLVDSARRAFCEKDTLRTIAILESIQKKYPTDGFVLSTNKALAELYIIQGRREEAKSKLLYALTYKNTSSLVFMQEDDCDKLLNRHLVLTARADLCVSLSKMYLNEKQFDSSLYYLNLANGEYLPYKTCGNGMNMYRSFLSPYFADCYLAMGDTTNAITRLLSYLINMDGNTVLLARKLKPILLQKYSQKDIAKEVRKGLKELNYTKIDDTYYVCLPLFGYTIKEYWGSKPKHYKKFYKKIPGLTALREN